VSNELRKERWPLSAIRSEPPASGGIGLAAGIALIRKGYRVFGTSRQAAPDEVRQGIHMLRCDVTDDVSVKQLIKDVAGLAGRIDVLVNNAGCSLIGAAEESSLDQARSLFDINVFGILRTTTEVLPIMRKQGQGRIINISSVAGFLPGPYTALYNATKHAVEGYSESLDHELRTFGIRVSRVEPVFTRTALEENGAKPDRILSVYDKGRAAMNATWRNGIAAGDPVKPWRTCVEVEWALRCWMSPGLRSACLKAPSIARRAPSPSSGPEVMW
jgi:short-subunit dehydrogenase